LQARRRERTTTEKKQELVKKAMKAWGKKCITCNYAGKLNYSFESEKGYKIAVAECPKCGFLLFMGEDGKHRWMIREEFKEKRI